MSGCLVFLSLILSGFMAIAPTPTYSSDFMVQAIPANEPPATNNYDRIDEVKKNCASVLSSAAEFNLDRTKVQGIIEDLYFSGGDWVQELGDYPLLPFDDTYIENNPSPIKLASFWVADVERDYRSLKSANVLGILILSISEDGSFFDRSFATHERFKIWPGQTMLSIIFHGIYTESESDGGKKEMCLLGNALLPIRDPHSADPWQRAKNSSRDPSFLSDDDQILLVLRYPSIFTLTSREIKGEMRSLNPKSNTKYFDKVVISSQLTKPDKYEFSSKKIIFRACDPYPYDDNSIKNIITYKDHAFCEVLEEITRHQAFSFLPNWKCDAADNVCQRTGPFEPDGAVKVDKLSLQNLKCEQMPLQGSAISARVSAVFRATSSSENLYSAGMRSGLSNMSLAVEGIWNSSSGQLCMIGCLGQVDAQGNSCNYRICMYISMHFSIKHRSIIFGTISSIDKSQSSLSFQMPVQPSLLWYYLRNSNPSYNYTRSNAAAMLLKKDRGVSFGSSIKKSLLKFPRLEDAGSFEDSLSKLLEDLTLHVFADPNQVPNMFIGQINLDIISVGPLFGRHRPYFTRSNSRFGDKESGYRVKAEYTEKQLLLNVSAQLSLDGRFKNFSLLFLEGLYDPKVGKMYLVGCRDIRASWKKGLFENMDVEDGLDCSIEVVISYPPAKARWLVDPTASVSISSQRAENSPLHFDAVKFKTSPITYREQREDILSRRGVEVILRMLTLSLSIGFISSQIFYMRRNVGYVPFLSLVMLGVQAIGYVLPLITGAEALIERAASHSNRGPSFSDLDGREWYRLINYSVKLLVMISLLLTLRLCQKVWKSRTRLLVQSPSDKLVLVATFLTHLVGFVSIILSSRRFQRSMVTWERELRAYAGLVQDFFLFPQVIGNLLWQIDGKPLRKLYFIGITCVRVFPHFYDYLTAPSKNPYVNVEYEFANSRFNYFSKFGDILIPTMAVLLAVLVYVQQKWSYSELSRALTFGRFKLLPMATRGYARLPSMQAESELSSGVGGGSSTRPANHTDLN